MTEHVHGWMVSSVKSVYLAVCNTLDVNGQATCDAELTANEIDTRLNEYETLKKATKEALDILYNIPEDLSSWQTTNASIQEAHDILEEAYADILK